MARYLLEYTYLTAHRITGLQRIDIVLRITRVESIKLSTVALDGKLLGPWVDEVRTIVADLGATAGRNDAVRLNLQGLSFADSSGIALLEELQRGGVELFGCSPLIAGLLDLHRASAGALAAESHAPGRSLT